MKFNKVTWLAILSLSILTVWFSYLVRKPLCIDSKVVERIDIVGSQDVATVYRCGLARQVPFNSFIYENLLTLNQKLSAIESVLSWNLPLKTKINITLVESRVNLFKVQSNEVYLSKNYLLEKNYLEKAIFKVWFRTHYEKQYTQSILTEEVVTDLMSHLANQKSLNLVAENEKANWPMTLKNIKDYCLSSARLFEHDSFCANLSQQDKLSESDMTDLSLRPFLSQTLIDMYRKLPMREQIYFFKNLNVIPHIETRFNDSVLGQIKKTVSQVAQVFQQSEEYISVLLRRSFDFDKNYLELDFALVSSESRGSQSADFEKIQKFSETKKDQNIAFIEKSKIWLFPNQSAIDLNQFEWKINKMMLVQCGPPQIEDVLSYEKYTTRLVVVDRCNYEKNNLDVIAFLASGIEKFASQNKEIYFVQFHLPSLRLAYEKMGNQEMSLYKMLSSEANQVLLSEAMGWRALNYVEAAEAFRPVSDIEAIEIFRAPGPKRNNKVN